MRKIRKINFKLIKNFSSLLMQQISIYIISLLTFGIISRILNPTEMGVYGLIVSLLYLVGLSANFGLKKVGIRLIAGYTALNEERKIRGTFWLTTTLSLPFIAVIIALVSYGIGYFKIFEAVESTNGLILFTILLSLFAFRNLIVAGLEALQLFHYETLYVSTGFLVYRLLMIYFLLRGYGVDGILVAWIIGEVLSIVLIMRKTVPQYSPPTLESEKPSNIIKDAAPLFIADIILAATEYGDRIVSYIFGPSILAYFYIATTGILFLTAMYQAIQGSMLPHLSEEYHLNGIDGLSNRIEDISRYIFIFVSPVFILAAALAEPLIYLLAGPAYGGAIPLFQIMSIGLWLGPLNPLLQSAFIAAKKNKELMIIMVASIIVDLVIMIGLYPYVGYISTGIGRASLIIVSYLLFLYVGIKMLSIRIDITAYAKSFIAGGISGLTIWLVWENFKRFDVFFIYFIAAGALYLIILRILKTVTPEEIASLYISLPYRERLISVIKIICYLSGIEHEKVFKMVEAR